jgi:hypothetical protein
MTGGSLPPLQCSALLELVAAVNCIGVWGNETLIEWLQLSIHANSALRLNPVNKVYGMVFDDTSN